MGTTGTSPPAAGPTPEPPRAAPRMDFDAADELRRQNLRRMKLFATSLLVLAAVVYALTTGRDGWLGFVNAAAEAAMIGALADWFAVTALFRHPLGIPVPHTAIIPTRKDALGRSLQEFVTQNFLAEDVVREKVGRADVGRRLGAWLSVRANADRVAAEISRGMSHALRGLKDDDATLILEHAILKPLGQRPWSPPAGRLLKRLVEDGAHHRIVDLGLEHLHRWLRENDTAVVEIVMERAPSWTPRWVNERLAERVYGEVVSFVEDIRSDPAHQVRLGIDDMLAKLAADLQSDPHTMRRADRIVARLISHPDTRAALTDVWVHTRQVLIEATEDPGSDLRHRVVDGLIGFGERLVDDERLRARVDRRVEDITGFLVRTYGHEVSSVISDTVERWDATDAARRIELHVGRDLQFIRVNGTVVGGLAGLVIHTLTVLFG